MGYQTPNQRAAANSKRINELIQSGDPIRNRNNESNKINADTSKRIDPGQRVMSFDFGLEKSDVCIKRKFRWLFKIDKISAEGVDSLPPSKSARPNLSFKTMEIIHLNENVFRPARPDWKPISLILFDLKKNKHPVFDWLKKQYDPQNDSKWSRPGNFIVQEATLELYDGCKNILETWVYENVWPESVDFTDLDMSSNEIVYVNLSLRYDRAYIKEGDSGNVTSGPNPSPGDYTPGGGP
jgi:hypothetical protein